MAYEWLEDCNKKNLKQKGNYGVRVARPGFDASNCADNLLLFNSGWPILQLCKVIDFDEANDTYTRYQLTDGTWSDTLPSGFQEVYEYTDTTEKYGINSKYIRQYVSTKQYMNMQTYEMIESKTYKRMSHNLGFVPFFIPADTVSGTNSNKVLLFTVDIETDVDYPYTEEALPFVSAPNDYGMKSSSIFGSRVPGLSTGQFSKLVQAVKTQETAVYTDIAGTKIPFWSPLENANSLSSSQPLTPFEAYGFAIVGSLNYNTNEAVYDLKDGGYYVPLFARSLGDGGSDEAYVYSLLGQAGSYFYKASLVVFRSPLVTPDYEEVEI